MGSALQAAPYGLEYDLPNLGAFHFDPVYHGIIPPSSNDVTRAVSPTAPLPVPAEPEVELVVSSVATSGAPLPDPAAPPTSPEGAQVAISRQQGWNPISPRSQPVRIGYGQQHNGPPGASQLEQQELLSFQGGPGRHHGNNMTFLRIPEPSLQSQPFDSFVSQAALTGDPVEPDPFFANHGMHRAPLRIVQHKPALSAGYLQQGDELPASGLQPYAGSDKKCSLPFEPYSHNNSSTSGPSGRPSRSAALNARFAMSLMGPNRQKVLDALERSDQPFELHRSLDSTAFPATKRTKATQPRAPPQVHRQMMQQCSSQPPTSQWQQGHQQPWDSHTMQQQPTKQGLYQQQLNHLQTSHNQTLPCTLPSDHSQVAQQRHSQSAETRLLMQQAHPIAASFCSQAGEPLWQSAQSPGISYMAPHDAANFLRQQPKQQLQPSQQLPVFSSTAGQQQLGNSGLFASSDASSLILKGQGSDRYSSQQIQHYSVSNMAPYQCSNSTMPAACRQEVTGHSTFGDNKQLHAQGQTGSLQRGNHSLAPLHSPDVLLGANGADGPSHVSNHLASSRNMPNHNPPICQSPERRTAQKQLLAAVLEGLQDHQGPVGARDVMCLEAVCDIAVEYRQWHQGRQQNVPVASGNISRHGNISCTCNSCKGEQLPMNFATWAAHIGARPDQIQEGLWFTGFELSLQQVVSVVNLHRQRVAAQQQLRAQAADVGNLGQQLSVSGERVDVGMPWQAKGVGQVASGSDPVVSKPDPKKPPRPSNASAFSLAKLWGTIPNPASEQQDAQTQRHPLHKPIHETNVEQPPQQHNKSTSNARRHSQPSQDATATKRRKTSVKAPLLKQTNTGVAMATFNAAASDAASALAVAEPSGQVSIGSGLQHSSLSPQQVGTSAAHPAVPQPPTLTRWKADAEEANQTLSANMLISASEDTRDVSRAYVGGTAVETAPVTDSPDKQVHKSMVAISTGQRVPGGRAAHDQPLQHPEAPSTQLICPAAAKTDEQALPVNKPPSGRGRRARSVDRGSSMDGTYPDGLTNGTREPPTSAQKLSHKGDKPGAAPSARPQRTTLACPQAVRSVRSIQKNNHKHRRLFSGEPGALQDGDKVYYTKQGGKRVLEGTVVLLPLPGILCSHCNQIVSCSTFEAHAGYGTHRKPYDWMVNEAGELLRDIASRLEEQNPAPEGMAPLVVHRHKTGSRPPKGSGSRRTSAENSSEEAAEAAPSVDSEDDASAGHLVVMESSCVICHQHEFDKEGFGDATVMICDQCEREFHVGCLRKHNICDLRELPKGDWFCGQGCQNISSTLATHVVMGDVSVSNNGHTWQLFRGKKGNRYATKTLNICLDILQESFDPIREPMTNSDMMPAMVHAQALAEHDFQGMHAILLRHKHTPVCTALLRVFGTHMAELPLVATKFAHRRKGHCRVLMDAIERLLLELGVRVLALPAAHDAIPTWKEGFGFREMDAASLEVARGELRMFIFPGTTVLYKILGHDATAPVPERVLLPTASTLVAGGQELLGTAGEVTAALAAPVAGLHAASPQLHLPEADLCDTLLPPPHSNTACDMAPPLHRAVQRLLHEASRHLSREDSPIFDTPTPSLDDSPTLEPEPLVQLMQDLVTAQGTAQALSDHVPDRQVTVKQLVAPTLSSSGPCGSEDTITQDHGSKDEGSPDSTARGADSKTGRRRRDDEAAAAQHNHCTGPSAAAKARMGHRGRTSNSATPSGVAEAKQSLANSVPSCCEVKAVDVEAPRKADAQDAVVDSSAPCKNSTTEGVQVTGGGTIYVHASSMASEPIATVHSAGDLEPCHTSSQPPVSPGNHKTRVGNSAVASLRYAHAV